MQFIPSKQMIEVAYRNGYAIPSFECWNAEMAQGILRVAQRMRAPVMLMSGFGAFPLMGPALQARVARSAAVDYDVPAALHLDHGQSLEEVRACLDAGYTSVMLDFSTRPFEENAAAMRQVVQWAHPLRVTVEAELGAVGKVDNITVEGAAHSTLTDPDDAARFVAETKVDMLAVSIGNAHGLYTRLPRFDFDRLERIRRQVSIPLVLHGGSGTPEEDIRRVIGLGVAKINIASEMCKALQDTLLREWTGGAKRWPIHVLADAYQAVEPVLEKWIRMTGAEGKA